MPRQGLYDPELERDSCGVGLVAHLKKQQDRMIVTDATEMLFRMSHRGGCGCDASSGDGAGMLLGMPEGFMRRVAKEDCGAVLPSLGNFAAGNIFLEKEDELAEAAKAVLNRNLKKAGFTVLGWRTVPVDNSMIGQAALDTEPRIEQVIVENTKKIANDAFERKLYKVRALTQNELAETGKHPSFYVCSLSSQTITYKGQLTPEQVAEYYVDLQQKDLESHMALVHSRFSTNTFPSWDRAQPNRMMCHNGEINTLRGNKNWMYSRSGSIHSPYFKDDTEQLLPITSDMWSDSGNFDSCMETLVKGSDRSIPEVMMMMIPEAWQDNFTLSNAKKNFYKYNSCVMEPWDGPAMIAFTDGRYIGATLDRNGLRPSRYYVTNDDRVLLSSEVGVVPELSDSIVVDKQRLEPGKMFLVDFDEGRIVPDSEIKESIAASRPYGEWLEKGYRTLGEWVQDAKTAGRKLRTLELFDLEKSNHKLNLFGFTTETMDMLLYPMAAGGKEALGSMGNDAPLAVLSQQPRQLSEYFKQLFAQVTNPPIDPIREELVMSLVCPVGPEANVLEVNETAAQRLEVPHPVLTLEEMAAIKEHSFNGWNTTVIDATFPVGSGPEGLANAVTSVAASAAEAVQGPYGKGGAKIIVLSDRLAGPDRLPIPSLLAVGAVHQKLLSTKQRSRAALFCESGDVREVHDFATITGFGCDAVCPWMAYEALSKMNYEGLVGARSGVEFTDEELFQSYRKAVAKGLLKVMAKMGISTLQSYKGAQIFECVGLSDEIVELAFTGTTSRLQGAGFEALYQDIMKLHQAAYPRNLYSGAPLLRNPGQYHYRNGGEEHLNTPSSMVALQMAGKMNSRDAFKEYSDIVDKSNQTITLRGLLKFRPGPKIPLEEVEPAQEIVKRFATGAMSLGSISQEAHESLAVAMNALGGRSNTGEGGEDARRYGDNRRSAIKQVASGRFGVTSYYLANSDQIQIKMAQGAKPGEGGELPGHKVTDYIASARHTTPGVGLISPPPHHDIYSIEDLAQLIHDLKNANPVGEVSVKLVSEVGVGVVAAGVAKAKADHITISGHDGGTGAAAWTGVKGAGLPFELGIAEAQQTLVLNGLRSRVRLQTDGQLKTARDVVIAALLGAEEFGFSTAPLIVLGCIMMRKCHLNTCPVGIATQDPELRAKFVGQPEHVVNYFWLMAERVREYMAELGFRTVDEMVGRADKLQVNESVLHYKSKGMDLSALLTPASELNPDAGTIKTMEQDHELELALDNELVAQAKDALENGEKVVIDLPVTNLNRTVGTILSWNVSKKYGEEGLPDGTITINLAGHGGQSLGFCLAKGVTLNVTGDSNDYVGKGLSGGEIVVKPDEAACEKSGINIEDAVVVGNVCLYGATNGKAFFRGTAGERFCVRNSGALAVVEGVGDHGCEYMTGGRVVVLGKTGRNFAAGMSGGIAYIYDPESRFANRCNMGMVELERLESAEEMDVLKSYIEEHRARTNSSRAATILENWEDEVPCFIKVMPTDYKRVLQERGAAKAAEADSQSASAQQQV
eukprot:scaffold7344_cov242-Pinguiococcus_pyrenoidosus.AAC.9